MRVRIGHDHGALDHVLELAHVARPGVRLRAPPARRAASDIDAAALVVGEATHEVVGEQGDVAAARAQRRDLDDDLREPVVEVLAELARRRSGPSGLWCVAHTMRTSTGISARPPMRSITRSCRKRSSFACSDSGRSPISSRNSVPPWAVSILPSVCLTAPVKAPFS